MRHKKALWSLGGVAALLAAVWLGHRSVIAYWIEREAAGVGLQVEMLDIGWTQLAAHARIAEKDKLLVEGAHGWGEYDLAYRFEGNLQHYAPWLGGSYDVPLQTTGRLRPTPHGVAANGQARLAGEVLEYRLDWAEAGDTILQVEAPKLDLARLVGIWDAKAPVQPLQHAGPVALRLTARIDAKQLDANLSWSGTYAGEGTVQATHKMGLDGPSRIVWQVRSDQVAHWLAWAAPAVKAADFRSGRMPQRLTAQGETQWHEGNLTSRFTLDGDALKVSQGFVTLRPATSEIAWQSVVDAFDLNTSALDAFALEAHGFYAPKVVIDASLRAPEVEVEARSLFYDAMLGYMSADFEAKAHRLERLSRYYGLEMNGSLALAGSIAYNEKGLTVHAATDTCAKYGRIDWESGFLRVDFEQLSPYRVLQLFNQKPLIAHGVLDLKAQLAIAQLPLVDPADVQGSVVVYSQGLKEQGIDLDRFLLDLESTQQVGLLDIASVAALGPAGLLVAQSLKGAKMAFALDMRQTTALDELLVYLELGHGKAQLADVAFRTTANRAAFKGTVDLNSAALEGVVFALLDEEGCARFEQPIAGTLDAPQVSALESGVKVLTGSVGHILGGGVQLVSGCKRFYAGAIPHPKEAAGKTGNVAGRESKDF